MGIVDGLRNILEEAGQQVTRSNGSWTTLTKTPQDIHFSNNFQEKARSWGLSEATARDVYRNGYVIKENMMVRKYNGYEVGIYYFRDSRTGQVVITSIWKRDRR